MNKIGLTGYSMLGRRVTRTTAQLLVPLIALSAALLIAQAAAGTTYYVSSTGSDSNNCSQASPCRQITKALTLVKAGDTISVGAGASYNAFTIDTMNGTASAPITIKAQGTGAQISPTSSQNGDSIYIADSSYIVIDGLQAFNANRAGIRVSNSPHVTVQNGVFGNNSKWGIFTDFTDDLLLQNNECYSSAQQHGIYVSNSSQRPTIKGNRSHDNAQCGIQINADASMGPPGVTQGAVIANNIIYNNGNPGGGAGINLDGVQNSTIVNNLLYNNHATGIANFVGDGASGATGMLIYNNTIDMASDGRDAIQMLDTAGGGNILRNNIIYNRNTNNEDIAYGNNTDASNTSSDYNIFDRSGSGETHSFTATLANLFVSSGTDYHLKSGSPAIDKGQTVASVTTDIEGHSRGQGAGYDIGAYEYASGGGTNPAPSPPINLRLR